jgi:hypothetical protein
MAKKASYKLVKLVVVLLLFLNGCGSGLVLDTPYPTLPSETSPPTTAPLPTSTLSTTTFTPPTDQPILPPTGTSPEVTLPEPDEPWFELPFRLDFDVRNLDKWSIFGSEAKISSGNLELFGRNVVVALIGLETWSNYSLRARVQLVSGGDFGILVGAKDTCSLYQMQFLYGKLEFIRYAGTACPSDYVFASLFDTSYPIAEDTWHEFQVDFQSPTITGYINGAKVFSVEDTAYASGKVGFRANAAQIIVDYLEVLPLPNNTPLSTGTFPYQGWIICWHGRAGHEFLIAYPEMLIQNGLDLTHLAFQHPWDRSMTDDLANNSLKACFYNGNWYWDPSEPWFPQVSYIGLSNNQIFVCDEIGTCSQQQWVFRTIVSPPTLIMNQLKQPNGTEIQILDYITSEDLP